MAGFVAVEDSRFHQLVKEFCPSLSHSKLRGIDLTNHGLERIPEVHDSDEADVLILNGNRLLNTKGLKAFVNLKILSLNLCGLSSVPEELSSFTALIILHISSNGLTSLPSLLKFPSLTILNISSNGLSSLPSLLTLPSLEALDVSRNMLESFPDSICMLSNMVVLSAFENKLKKLPVNLGQLKKLKFLDLHKNYLTEVPQSVDLLTELEGFLVGVNLLGQAQVAHVPTGWPTAPTLYLRWDMEAVVNAANMDQFMRRETVFFRSAIMHMINLKELDVRFCGLLSFPDEMKHFKQMEVLSVSGNRLVDFPQVFFHLRLLKILEMMDCQLIELPSEIGNLKELRTLNLASNGLESLPQTLGCLDNLLILHLSGNNLTRLPNSVGNLASLNQLHLSENMLSVLPESVSQLSQLRMLNLANNRLENLPETLGCLDNLLHANISGNILKRLPDSVGNLTQLLTLNLTGNKLARLPNSIGHLASLTSLVLSGNKISRLPETIGELKKLNSLDLSPFKPQITPAQVATQVVVSEPPSLNRLSSLPINIGELTLLCTLNLSSNNLTTLPDSISKLENLTVLNLSDNKIVSLPDDIGKLKALRQLNLSGNTSLNKLPASFGKLENLEWLLIYSCHVSNFPRELAELKSLKLVDLSLSQTIRKVPAITFSWTSLTALSLQFCGLKGLQKELVALTMLEELLIRGNKEISIFPDVIAQLYNLKVLNVECCSISSFPPSIASLKKLTHLFAGNNRFTEYPATTLELQSLDTLDLSNQTPGMHGNRIEELPKDLVNKPKTLRILQLWGTGTKSPPEEICALGLAAIRQYLQAVELGDQRFCAESVCLLGETCAGKTSILLSMKEQHLRLTDLPNRTRVVERVVITLGDRLVTINDFGGHEIYQTVLPVFLPRKGVAILAYDISDSWVDQEVKVRRWIATIIARSPGMNLIVAGTHADLVENEKLTECKTKMEKLVFEMFAQAISELEAHNSKRSLPSLRELAVSRQSSAVEELENSDRSTSAAANRRKQEENSGNELAATVKLLKSAHRVVITLSCKDASKGDGIRKLETEILKIIQPGIRMPEKWVHFMTALLKSEATQARTHLSMAETRTFFSRFIERPEEKILLTILRYLVATSRIIWLENHQELHDCIFHQVSAIQDVCKAILHHDSPTVPPVLEDDVRKYKLGQLTLGLYKHFLSAYGPDAVLLSLRRLLQAFNVVCSGMDNESNIMLVPSLLPKDDRPRTSSSTGLSCASASFLPQVCVRMEFLASIIPLSFFEISLASLVDRVSKTGKAKPRCWKNGFSYQLDDLTLYYERINDAVNISVAAIEKVSFSALWKEFGHLLTVVIRHIECIWPGAMPKVYFVCPTRLYATGGPYFSSHGRDVPLEEVLRDEEPAGQRKYYCDCGEVIPRVFCFYCKPEHISEDHEKDAVAFLEKMRKQHNGALESEESEDTSKLASRFRKERMNICKRLDDVTILHIIDILYGEGHLTELQKDDIEAKPTKYQKARTLVDKIEARGPSVIQAFLEALESEDVGMPDLANRLRSDN